MNDAGKDDDDDAVKTQIKSRLLRVFDVSIKIINFYFHTNPTSQLPYYFYH